MGTVREDAERIIEAALASAQPDTAVRKALENFKAGNGRIVLVSIGKAAWQMAKSASDVLGDRISDGVVITKYDHVMGSLPHIRCYEAGHPVPDEHSFQATQKAIELTADLGEEDRVLLLISGGGSALFENPLISGDELQEITKQLLASGADIVEMNIIRKRLSKVKGGRFAQLCAPAKVFAIVLSDIIGDPLDMIASGPAYPDSSTCAEAEAVVKKYGLELSEEVLQLLKVETPKSLDNVETCITGSVKQLCISAEEVSRERGYEPVFLTAAMCCEAREAGSFLASIAKDHQAGERSLAYIAGGETVVHLTGHGKGGRNQEIVLSAAKGIRGLKDTLIFSLGSDGTDGPTDAAGGIADGASAGLIASRGIDIDESLRENDAYNALHACGGLLMTGPTGTNVNDLTVLLIKRQPEKNSL